MDKGEKTELPPHVQAILCIFGVIALLGIAASMIALMIGDSKKTNRAKTENRRSMDRDDDDDKPPRRTRSSRDDDDDGTLLEVSNITTREQYGNITVYFKITNKTDRLCSYAAFNVYFYDSRDEVVGSGFGNVTNIPAQGAKRAHAIGLDIHGAKKVSVQLSGYPMFE